MKSFGASDGGKGISWHPTRFRKILEGFRDIAESFRRLQSGFKAFQGGFRGFNCFHLSVEGVSQSCTGVPGGIGGLQRLLDELQSGFKVVLEVVRFTGVLGDFTSFWVSCKGVSRHFRPLRGFQRGSRGLYMLPCELQVGSQRDLRGILSHFKAIQDVPRFQRASLGFYVGS